MGDRSKPDRKAKPVARAVICVLGMHRSGTSLVTRCLNLLGMSIGRKGSLLPPSDPDNPAGFWEHQGFIEINDAILERFGGSWHRPPELPAGWETSPQLSDLRGRAEKLIVEDFEDYRQWGWKDPRNSLTLAFWRQIVPDMQCVVCMRNPLDVARSLSSRDGFSEEKSLELWMEYTLAASLNTSGQPRILTFYEDYFMNRERALERLATFLGRKVPTRHSERYRHIEAFLQQELWHQKSSVLDLIEYNNLDLAAKSLYVMPWSLMFDEAQRKERETPSGAQPGSRCPPCQHT